MFTPMKVSLMKPSVVSACLRRNFIRRSHGICLVFSSDQSFPAWLGRLCSRRSWRVACELVSELVYVAGQVNIWIPSASPPLPRQPARASLRLHDLGSPSRVFRRHWEVCSNYINDGMSTRIKTLLYLSLNVGNNCCSSTFFKGLIRPARATTFAVALPGRCDC